MNKDSKINEYNYKSVHNDLEKGIYAGAYGWDNAAYIAIAGKRAKLDLENHHAKRSPDEHYISSLKGRLN